MRRIYDLPVNPLIRTSHVITLVELMNDILETNSDTRDEYLVALLGLLDVAMRDLHSSLEGNEFPGGHDDENDQ